MPGKIQTLTPQYISRVIEDSRQTLFLLTTPGRICEENIMSRILSALIVGLFAASAFAADAPAPVVPPDTVQTAPAKASPHKHHRHHRHHRHHGHHGHKHHAAAPGNPVPPDTAPAK